MSSQVEPEDDSNEGAEETELLQWGIDLSGWRRVWHQGVKVILAGVAKSKAFKSRETTSRKIKS